MEISWTPPDDDGGTPVIGYRVENKENNGSVWKKVNLLNPSDTTTVVKDLKEYTEYEFRVHAENEVGASDESSTSEPYRTLGSFFFCLFACLFVFVCLFVLFFVMFKGV